MFFLKRLKLFFLNSKIQDGRMARKFWWSQVVDPHSFYADPDPSILSFDADLCRTRILESGSRFRLAEI